jgi:site-specific DNA recombinase
MKMNTTVGTQRRTKVEIELIKANDPFDGSSRRRIERLRVAAYCRVSTDDEDQIKSYNSMIRHYTDLIQSNKEYIFAGVYADRAITGTKVDKREEFQRLIQDCMDGKIDLIIAKSIPRFARNTLDTLKYVRMLKERNIAVYFEVEKINTLKDGEFLMTILSSVAQQEVENTSAYVKKGLKMKMKRGELVGFQGCLGYDYDVNTKSISINEEGAKTVRYIFDRYVAGAGSTMIARELNEQGILTIKGNPWVSSSVMGIINNEKYKGDILLGKTFTVDPISKRRLDNLGEEDRYYIHNHHEGIVSEETFDRAQEIRNRRNGGRKHNVTPGKREKFSRQYAFSCMLECGFCGASLSRRRWHSNSKYKKTIWQCVKSTKNGKRFCPDSKGIPEQVIEEAFIESYRMLCKDNRDVLDEFLRRVEKTLGENSIPEQITALDKNISKIQAKRKVLLDKYLKGIVSQDIYEETDIGLKKDFTNEKAKLEYLQQQLDDETSLQRRVSDFKKALSENEVLEEFDRGIFESIIEKVIVGGFDEDGNKDPYKITFIYKTGLKNEIGNAKERFDKSKKMGDKTKELCSHIADELKGVCSFVSDNTCGDCSIDVKKIKSSARKRRISGLFRKLGIEA